MKVQHHLAFFILIIFCGALLFFSSELLVPESIKKIVFRSPQIDTIGHCISFFILSWIVSSILKVSLKGTFITLAFYGAFSELGQYYLGFRNAEFTDFFADIAGVGFFVFLKFTFLKYKIYILKKIINKKNTIE